MGGWGGGVGGGVGRGRVLRNHVCISEIQYCSYRSKLKMRNVAEVVAL